MFGDFFQGGTIGAVTGGFDFVNSDLPLAGGSRRVKIAEHNKAVPTDRIYFLYHHFHNAIDVTRFPAAGTPISNSYSLDRFTIGFEKTWDCNNWSAELRMPFTGGFDLVDIGPGGPGAADFRMATEHVGDLSLILKRVLFSNSKYAVAGGIGVNLPTGSDVEGSFIRLAQPVTYRVNNDAVHLLPYLGFVAAPRDDWFAHGFIQFDFATDGNRVSLTNAGGTTSGTVNEQNLLYLDLSVGRWLHRQPNNCWWRGTALLGEIHYTHSLQSVDTFPIANFASFGNFLGDLRVTNATIGLHVEMTECTSLRFGGVFPLSSQTNQRLFDSEVQAALIRKF